MSGQRTTVTMVNHVEMEIAAAPDAVWQAILDDYVDARKFREIGQVDPIDDPAALFGGYRTRIEKDGVVIDERIVHVTERDEATRRLSAYADYLSVPGGLQVYATYQAREVGDGTVFTIDCHSRPALELPAEPAARIALIDAMRKDADGHMIQYLEGIKARLEGAATA